MFRTLHRLLVLGYWCFWAAVLFWLYTQRARFQPAVDYAELLVRQDRSASSPLTEFTGTVARVYSGVSFQVRDGNGALLNYGLAGVSGPVTNGPTATAGGRLLAAQALTNLSDWIVGAPVRIEVMLENPASRTGLGVVWRETTNINARVLAQGLGTLRRDQIRRLPVLEQYGLVRAERQARRERRGVWAADE